MQIVQPPTDEIAQRLAEERASLVDLTARLEVRDGPALAALESVEAQLASARVQQGELEVQLETHRAATAQLEATGARLGRSLTGWRKVVARTLEPVLVACALFFGLIAWGLNRSLLTTALIEGAGLALGLVLARFWRARV